MSYLKYEKEYCTVKGYSIKFEILTCRVDKINSLRVYCSIYIKKWTAKEYYGELIRVT